MISLSKLKTLSNQFFNSLSILVSIFRLFFDVWNRRKNGRVSYLNYCDIEIFILKVSWHLTVKLFLFNFSILSRQRASLFSRLSPLIHQFGPFHSFAPYLFCLQMFDSSKISRVAIALLLLLKKNGLFMVREMNPFIAMSFKCVQNICLLLSGNSAQLWLQFQPC